MGNLSQKPQIQILKHAIYLLVCQSQLILISVFYSFSKSKSLIGYIIVVISYLLCCILTLSLLNFSFNINHRPQYHLSHGLRSVRGNDWEEQDFYLHELQLSWARPCIHHFIGYLYFVTVQDRFLFYWLLFCNFCLINSHDLSVKVGIKLKLHTCQALLSRLTYRTWLLWLLCNLYCILF